MSARQAPPPHPCLLVIFGGIGDLAQRLLIPAIYNLAEAGRLPARFALVGIARQALSDEQYRERMGDAIRASMAKNRRAVNERILERLVRGFHYWQGDSTLPETYPRLREFIEHISHDAGTGGAVLYYLATPPALFSEIPPRLSAHGLFRESSPLAYRRVIFEKPFGHDLRSARALNRQLSQVMREDQIYRIDHYLGKETVQNILVLRFANSIFEPIWNRRYIDSVQITVAETLGVESRAAYYDTAGALRDMVPNHLFQLLALIGMEPPNSFAADDVRNEKVKLLRAIAPLRHDRIARDVVRGQYAGYRSEPGVTPDSTTETYVALKLAIDNWRWSGVPFYLRTGKRLPCRATEVAVRFNCAPLQLFSRTEQGCTLPNQLVLGIQPRERISLAFSAKEPGPTVRLGEVAMDFDYARSFGHAPQTGYETLLHDAMIGDATLFQRADQIEAAWSTVDPLLRDWEEPRQTGHLLEYPAGSWGPAEASELVRRDGREWQLPQVASRPESEEEAA